MPISTLATIVLIGGFFLLMFLKIPVTFSLLLSTCAAALIEGTNLTTLVRMMIDGVNNISLLSIPFFILMGEIMSVGEISDKIVGLANLVVGRFRGGLAYVNCLDSMFFGGVSGSAVADVSSLGAIVIPLQVKQGYSKEFAVALTVTTACEGVLIPPSHNMVMYAMVAGSVSVGRLFLGGILPGFLLGFALMIYSYILSVKRNYPKGAPFSLKHALTTLKDAVWGLITVLIVVFGVVSGVFTATESAAMAVVWAMIVSTFIYKELTLPKIWHLIERSLGTLAIVMILISTSQVFGWLLTYLRLPEMVANGILGLTSNPLLIMLILNVLMLILGTIMDMSAIILVATPILLPIAIQAGMDPVHFGVVMILNLGIGLITPPVGGTLFVGSAVSGVPIEKLIKTLLPFLGVMVIVLLLITYVPGLIMFLPNLIMPVMG